VVTFRGKWANTLLFVICRLEVVDHLEDNNVEPAISPGIDVNAE